MLYYFSTIASLEVWPTPSPNMPSFHICLKVILYIKLLLLKCGGLFFFKSMRMECEFCPNQWALTETSLFSAIPYEYIPILNEQTYSARQIIWQKASRFFFFLNKTSLGCSLPFLQSARPFFPILLKHLCLHCCNKGGRWKCWILEWLLGQHAEWGREGEKNGSFWRFSCVWKTIFLPVWQLCSLPSVTTNQSYVSAEKNEGL